MNTDIAKFVQQKLDDAYYTPDTPVIFNHDWHPLFVYGTLKKGFIRHEVLTSALFVGTGFTRGTGFAMYETTQRDPYPVALPATTETPGAIYGEVYLVSPDVLRTLDFIEYNGVQYGRSYRVVDINNKKSETKVSMPMWIYLSDREVWKEAITKKGVIPCDTFHRKDNSKFKYYLFKNKKGKDVPLRNM